MKKLSLITGLLFAIVILQAQIKVAGDNNVAIHTNNALSKISVGHEGFTNYYYSVYSPTSLNGFRMEIPSTLFSRFALVGYTPGGTGYARAIYGTTYILTPTNSGRSYGVRGDAGNSTSGYNYAIYGNICGTNNGAGIYGTVNTADTYIDGIYAGYFNGNVKIVGNAWINGSTVVTSDINQKKEVTPLKKEKIDQLAQLNAIKYKLKSPWELAQNEGVPGYAPGQASTTTDSIPVIETDPQIQAVYNKERIGLSAQEVQQVYPELVETAQDGTLGVDYTGLIPILIEAIKEQQQTLEKQQAKIQVLEQEISRIGENKSKL